MRDAGNGDTEMMEIMALAMALMMTGVAIVIESSSPEKW